MAKKRPVRIWAIKHNPRREPKFHHTEMFEGAGRSTTAWLAIFRRGCVFRRLAIKVKGGGPVCMSYGRALGSVDVVVGQSPVPPTELLCSK